MEQIVNLESILKGEKSFREFILYLYNTIKVDPEWSHDYVNALLLYNKLFYEGDLRHYIVIYK